MAVEVPPPTARRASGARERILDTATTLFYESGIRAVGIDLLIRSAKVTKATFYKYFESKDALVLAVIETRAAEQRAHLRALREAAASPAEALRAIIESVIDQISSPAFRGSAFANAAAELAHADHPVRRAIAEHRDWVSELLASLLREHGIPLPGDGADDLQLAWDGAMVGGHIGDPVAACAALSRALDRLLAGSANGPVPAPAAASSIARARSAARG